MDAGRVVFENLGVPVKRKETWVIKANALVRHIFGKKAPQINVEKEDTDMAFSDEDKAFMSSMMANAVADGLKPLQEKVDGLQANQETMNKAITANADAALAEKRKIVANKFSQAVADALSGDALDAMVKQCGEPASLMGNHSSQERPGAIKADIANLPKE